MQIFYMLGLNKKSSGKFLDFNSLENIFLNKSLIFYLNYDEEINQVKKLYILQKSSFFT